MKQRPATPYELALHYRSMLHAIAQFEQYLDEVEHRPPAAVLTDLRDYLDEDREQFSGMLDYVLPQLTLEQRTQVTHGHDYRPQRP